MEGGLFRPGTATSGSRSNQLQNITTKTTREDRARALIVAYYWMVSHRSLAGITPAGAGCAAS